MKRFKLELVYTMANNGVRTTRTTFGGWFDEREHLDASVNFMRACPLDNGEMKFRITEYGMAPIKVEEV